MPINLKFGLKENFIILNLGIYLFCRWFFFHNGFSFAAYYLYSFVSLNHFIEHYCEFILSINLIDSPI